MPTKFARYTLFCALQSLMQRSSLYGASTIAQRSSAHAGDENAPPPPRSVASLGAAGKPAIPGVPPGPLDDILGQVTELLTQVCCFCELGLVVLVCQGNHKSAKFM